VFSSLSRQHIAEFASVAATALLFQLTIFFIVSQFLSVHGGSIWDILSDNGRNEYVTLAHSLIAENRFVLVSDIPDTFRTPGYPGLLALLFLLVSDSYMAIAIMHAVLASISAALVAFIAQQLHMTRRFSYVAAALFSLSSGTIFAVVTGQGADLMYTCLYVIALTLCITFACSARPTLVHPLMIGGILGVATLARPIGILGSLPLFAALAVMRRWNSIPDLISSGKYSALAIGAFLLVIMPWGVRNHLVAGEFTFSTLPAYNFVFYNIPLAEAFWNDTNEHVVRQSLHESLGNPPMDLLRNAPYAQQVSGIMKEYIGSHFFSYAFFHTLKMIPFFVGSGLHTLHGALVSEAPSMRLSLFPTDEFNITAALISFDWKEVIYIAQRFWLVTADRLFWVTIFAFALAAPFLARGFEQKVLVVIVAIILSNAFLTSPVAHPRYRIPAEPFIWIAAVYTLYSLTKPRTKDSPILLSAHNNRNTERKIHES